jgi:WD40 repeat protein
MPLTAPLKKWIEHVISLPGGGCAAVIGKQVVLYTADHQESHRWTHASAVTGLALDPKGKRLAASHYNGVSLWWLNNPASAATVLHWKGSHTGVTWSPDGKFIVTMMQEMALHGWRLADQAHMRMAGYPTKTKSAGWALKGKYLVTSGAPAVVCWPFTGKDGPMGKAPLELPPLSQTLTTTVACYPKRDMVAAGYADGLLLMFRMEDQADLTVAEATGSAVAGLAFSADGKMLGFAREDGSAGFVALP